MWIETIANTLKLNGRDNNSFASNGECGLKHPVAMGGSNEHAEFIRQQWRMWIETPTPPLPVMSPYQIHSPAMANVD